MASLARQSTPVGNRLDRTAAHAAVRNLAESYGVDLLPLDLSTDISLTPAPVPRRVSEPGGPQQQDKSITLQLDELSPAALSDPLESLGSASAKSQRGSLDVVARRAASSDLNSLAGEASSKASDLLDAAAAPSLSVVQDAAAAHLAGQESEAAEDVYDQSWGETPEATEYLSEAEYLECQIPLEQRISLLEEERDILVDKLLATTEALHASEARNRQSQASASQVGALLEQLQELLRRAEVERDRAKLQLKRQRGSPSQVSPRPDGSSSSSTAIAGMAAAAGPLLYTVSASVTTAHQLAGSHSSMTASTQAAGGSSDSSECAAISTQPLLSEELQQRKKHKSSSSEAELSASGGAAADATAGVSCAAPDVPALPTSPVTLTPSTDEVRPPVKSVISGFEALMQQRKRAAARKAAAARAAAAAQAEGVEYVSGSVCSSESGTPKSINDADAAGLPSEDVTDGEPSQTAAAGSTVAVEATVHAEALQVATQMPPIRVPTSLSEGSSSSAAPAAAAEAPHNAASQELPGASSGFSVGSPTPTAAALCSTIPAGFGAEVLATDGPVSDTASDVTTPSYAQVAAHNCSNWKELKGGRSSKSSSPSPTRQPRLAAVMMAGAQPQRRQSDGSSSTGSGAAVGFSMGRSSAGSSPKAAHPQTSAAAGQKTHGSSRLGINASESILAVAVAEAATLKQRQQQQQQSEHLYNPQEFTASSSSEFGSDSPSHASMQSAAAGVVPQAASAHVVAFTAAKQQDGAADSKKKKKKKKQDKQQLNVVTSKVQSTAEAKANAGATAAAVANAGSPADCVAEVLTSDSAAAVEATAPLPLNSAITTADKAGDSNSSTPRSSKGKKTKGNSKQSENLGKTAAVATAAQTPPKPAVDMAAAPLTNSGAGLLLKVALVLLLLCSGGLLYALWKAKSTYSMNTAAQQQMVMSYNWQLKALRDKVSKLERQLTEKDAQLGSCNSEAAPRDEL